MTARRPTPTLAIVVPVLFEPEIGDQLERLCTLAPDELIVVEVGEAQTSERLQAFAAAHGGAPALRILRAPRGRAAQMNAGASTARSDILLFLHADTLLQPTAPALVREAILGGAVWGRFDVRLAGARAVFRVIEWFMNWRSALTGIATGDQAIFVRRDAFNMLGGFAPMALMEDIELSSRLKWVAPPFRIRTPVVTSARRWERYGVARTVLQMWLLRTLFALGVSPRRLARWYR